MQTMAIDIKLSIEEKDNLLVAHLLFFNNMPKKFYLDKYTICYNGKFNRNVFAILDEKSKKVNYIGPMVKRLLNPEDFIVLESGKSKKTTVVLNDGYQLQQGKKYFIQYGVYHPSYLREQVFMRIESNIVEVIHPL